MRSRIINRTETIVHLGLFRYTINRATRPKNYKNRSLNKLSWGKFYSITITELHIHKRNTYKPIFMLTPYTYKYNISLTTLSFQRKEYLLFQRKNILLYQGQKSCFCNILCESEVRDSLKWQ